MRGRRTICPIYFESIRGTGFLYNSEWTSITLFIIYGDQNWVTVALFMTQLAKALYHPLVRYAEKP